MEDMKRCVILLDGPEKTESIKRELVKDDLVVAVDRGLDTCFTLDRPPAVAFLGDGNASDRAMDWAAFSGAAREEYKPRDGQSGFELALEWALTSSEVNDVLVLNALGRTHADDAARMLTFCHVVTELPLTMLTEKQRIFRLAGGYTVNGKPKDEFSLIPLDAGSGIHIKNGKADYTVKGLAPGSAVLLRCKLEAATANLTVTAGRFLAYLPR